MKEHLIPRFVVLTGCLAMLIFPTGALAEHFDQSIDLSSSLGLYSLSSKLDYDSGLAWGLGIGLNLSEKVGTEFSFHAVDSEYHGYDAQILLYKLDLVYHLTGRLPENIVPYAAAGIGMASFNNDQPEFKKDSDVLFNAALGLKYFLTRNIAVRTDVRYVLDFAGSDLTHNFLYTAGINLRLGWQEDKYQVPEPVAVVEPEPCPNPPQGCLERDWCKRDADADGVVDCLDKCPDTPPACPVDQNGCPKDSDGDGVPDCLDKCPDTPPGTRVEAYGCPPAAEQGSIVFRNILFEFDSADLKAESLAVLDQVVEYLRSNPGVSMEIQGHTDNVGTAEYNLRLSSRRAQTVRDYLMNKGIPPERLEVQGLGLSSPLVPNDTEENRARNRRVEFKPI